MKAVLEGNQKLKRTDPNGHEIDPKLFVTASEAYKCIRKLSYEKQLDSAPPLSEEEVDDIVENSALPQQGYFERGDAIEEWFFNTLNERAKLPNYIEIQYSGEDQATFTYEHEKRIGTETRATRIAGTPDGVIYNHQDDIHTVVEIKSVSEEYMEPLPRHLLQLSLNVTLYEKFIYDNNMKGDNTVFNGLLVYINASNWLNIKEWMISHEKAGKTAAKVYDKAQYLHRRDAPPDGLMTGECKSCPFVNSCLAEVDGFAEQFKEVGRIRSNPFQELSPAEKKEVKERIAPYYIEAVSQSKYYDDIKNRSKSALQAYLAEEGSLEVGNMKISMSEVKGRVTYDYAKMKQDGINLSKYERVSDPSYRINLREKK